MNYFNMSFDFIKTIDSFYRDTDEVYKTLFIDNDDIIIYRDNDNDILEYTKMLMKRILSEKKINNLDKMLHYMIVCYIISIKFYTDCFISRPYSNIIDLLDNENIELEYLISIEKYILKKFDYKI